MFVMGKRSWGKKDTARLCSEREDVEMHLHLRQHFKWHIILYYIIRTYFGRLLLLMPHLVGTFSPELCGLERSGGDWEEEEDAC